MAEHQMNGARKFTIDAADTFRLGDASSGVVGTFGVHLVSDSFNGVIKVKARSRLNEAQEDGVTFQQIPYEKLFLNGAVGDGSLVSTDITGDSVILVPASGLEIALDCTAYTSGSMDVYVVPLEGAAA